MRSYTIALATFGSHGDLHPFLAIARELRRRGHHPVIATVGLYKNYVETAGFEFRQMRFALDERRLTELIRKVMNGRDGLKFLVRELMMPALPVAYADALSAFVDVDLVVVHPLAYAARLAAETMKIPWTATKLVPIGFVSAYDPPTIVPATLLKHLRPLGPAFFGPLLWLMKRDSSRLTEPYDRFRSELGLPPSRNPIFEGGDSPGLILALFSKTLGAAMPDWPPQTVVTGFTFYDGVEHSLPKVLEDFLDTGEPPIVFTLGTAAVHDAGSFYAESAKALKKLGRRGVLLVGSNSANIPLHLPDTILPVAYAPFSLLFPRSAAIVHQGGVGTTAQAMRSGRPMLIVPFGMDQPDNAERMRRLGVARVLSRKRFSAQSAVRELEALLGQARYQFASASVAKQIAAEDGAVVACDYLERRLETSPRNTFQSNDYRLAITVA